MKKSKLEAFRLLDDIAHINGHTLDLEWGRASCNGCGLMVYTSGAGKIWLGSALIRACGDRNSVGNEAWKDLLSLLNEYEGAYL